MKKKIYSTCINMYKKNCTLCIVDFYCNYFNIKRLFVNHESQVNVVQTEYI